MIKKPKPRFFELWGFGFSTFFLLFWGPKRQISKMLDGTAKCAIDTSKDEHLKDDF